MSKNGRIKIGIMHGVFTAVLLAVILLLLEGAGTFAGYILDRPCVNSYIKKNYPGITYKCEKVSCTKENREIQGISSEYKAYCFEFTVKSASSEYGTLKAGDSFSIDAYNFTVLRDSIFTDYTRDAELEDALNEQLLLKLVSFWEEQNVGITPFEVYAGINIKLGEYEGSTEDRVDLLLTEEALKNCITVLHCAGEKKSFEDYKADISKIVTFYDENSELKPGGLQIIYYYTDENGEKVMQFESKLEVYEMSYTEETLKNGDGIHYKVETTDSEKKQLLTYNIVKNVYICVVAVSVTVLSGYWIYKKTKKIQGDNEDLKDKTADIV